MDLRRLAIFLAVVDEDGFSRAADVLDVSQPTISQAIHELEAGLGARLFDRVGRSVRLTPAGFALLAPARQINRDVASALHAVDAVVKLEAGRLELACLPTLAASPLAPLVGEFNAAYPAIEVAIAGRSDSTALVDVVRSGQCEIGIVETLAATDLAHVNLGRQDMLVVLPPGAAAPDPFPVRRLASTPVVAAPRGSSTRRLLDEALARYGREANVVVESAQREALLPLVVAGVGIGLLPRPVAEVGAALGCVVVHPRPRVSRSVSLVHRAGSLTPPAERFVEIAISHGGRRVGRRG